MSDQAILVMESHGITPGTRSFQFSDAWSRLYQVGEYFVDLMYQPGENAKLHGQVLRADGAPQTFSGKAKLSSEEGGITDEGQFDLVVDDAAQSLTLNLNDKVIEFNGLSFLKATMW